MLGRGVCCGVPFAASLRLIAVAALAFALGAWWSGGESRTRLDARTKQKTDAPATAPLSGTTSVRTLEEFAAVNAASAGLRERLLTTVRQRDYFRRKHDLYELGLSLDAAGLRAAMDAAMTMSTMDRDWAHPALLSRWQDVDPDGALEWIRALPRGKHQDFMVREYFNVLALKDPEKGLPVMLTWKATPENPHEGELYQFFEGWTRHDPIGAARAAVTLPTTEDRSSALGQALERWARRDPHGALAFHAQAPGAEEWGSIYEGWAEEDPKAALAHVILLPEGKEREAGLASVIRTAADGDREGVFRLVEQLPAGPARTEAIQSAIGAISWSDARTASELIMLLPAEEQNRYAGSVAQRLAGGDAAAAVAWAERLGTSEARGSALGAIVQGMADTDPQAVLALVGDRVVDLSENTIEQVASGWAEKAPEAALEWAKTLPAGNTRDTALVCALAKVAATDPRRALTLAGQFFTKPEQAVAFGRVAYEWAQTDPAAAATWAAQSLNESARDRTLPQAIHRWVAQDPSQVGEWLDQMPAGAARDAATIPFIHAVAGTDPYAAADWAATIANPEQRQRMVREVLFQWHKANPAEAEEWLHQETSVPESLRKNLLRIFTQ